MPSKPPPDDPAVADLLFDDDPPRRPAAPKGKTPVAPSDGYELEGGDLDDDEPAPAPRAAFVPSKPAEKPKARAKAEPSQEARVDQVWTRGAEWGPTLLLVGGVAAAFLVMTYVIILNDQWIAAFFCLLCGGGACLVLSYPIFITLERPVRITPEQAAKDYFAALSHALPHYRRMWLLLSTPAQEAPDFGSQAGFRSYWKRRIAQLRADAGRPLKPLAFEVADFKAEKSAGKTFIDGKFTVVVREASDPSGTPLESIRMSIGFAKGPDNMWYLNSGTLPGRV